MIKFRSMRVNAESDGRAVWAKLDDPRVTRVGAWIRRLRIDELPQAVNVLLGHMSFVGPRPERPEFVAQLARRCPSTSSATRKARHHRLGAGALSATAPRSRMRRRSSNTTSTTSSTTAWFST